MKQQLLEAELKNAKAKIALLEEQLRNEVSGKNWRDANGKASIERALKNS